MRFLKWIWSEFNNEDTFGYKFVLPIIGLFLTWGFLSNLHLLTLEQSDLAKITGLVSSIEVVEETSNDFKHRPLLIKLDNYSETFRLRDSFEELFGEILNSVQTGDSIIIYKRPYYTGLLTMGMENDIYQIEKGGKVVFSRDKIISNNITQCILFLIFAIVTWSIYAYYLLIIKKRNKKTTNIT